MSKIKQITEGYSNLVKKGLGVSNTIVEALAEERYTNHCHSCEDRKEGKCGVCGCLLGAKIRSLTASCPKGKW